MTDLDVYLDPALVDAERNPFGDRRFFPPGEHPATRRYRDYLASCEKLRARLVTAQLPTTDVDALIDYAGTLVASFEEEESIAKADYLRMLRR